MKITSNMIDRKSLEIKYGVINNIAGRLGQDKTISTLLTSVRDELSKALNVKNFSVYSYTKESNALAELIHFVNDLPEERNDSIDVISQSQVIKVLTRKKKAMLFTEKELLTTYGINAHAKNNIPSSIVGIPLLEGNKLLGLMILQSFESENTYSDNDLELLTIIGIHIGIFFTRKQTEDALKRSEERNRALIQGSSDVIFRLDSAGNIKDFHAAPGELILSPKKFMNANITNVLPPEKGWECLALIKSVIKSGDMKILYHDIWYKNVHYYFEGRIVKSGENEVLKIVRNITKQIKQEKKIHHSFADLQLIDQINQASLKNATFKELVHEILDIHHQIIPISGGRFYLFDEDTAKLEFVEERLEFGLIKQLEVKSGIQLEKMVASISKQSSFYKAIEARKILAFQDEASIRKIMEEHPQDKLMKKIFALPKNLVNIKTFLIIPYVFENKIFGLMTLTSKQKISESRIRRIQSFNNQIIAALAKTKVEQEIAEQKKFNEEILNNIPADIVVFDKDHSYLYINPEAVKNRETREWLIGKNDFDYARYKGTSDDEAKRRHQRFEEAVETKSDIEFVDKHLTKDGLTKYILRKFHPYFENSTLKQMIGYGVDITKRVVAEKSMEKFTKQLELKVEQRTHDLRQSQERLEKALEKEKQLGDLKSRFVATASHQFRTPMSIIQSNSDLLAMLTENSDMELRPKLEKAVDRIQKEIKRMTNLMDDILVLGKITAGRVATLQFQPTDLLLYCKELVEGYNEIQITDRSIDIEYEGRRRKVSIDQKLIGHVLSNLISNALKYSTVGNPRIRLEFKKDDVKILVIDQGIGIPPKEMPELFEPFHRAENVGNIPGTGLGLTIAKEYVDLIGGEISVESELNKGTTFTLTFPNDKKG